MNGKTIEIINTDAEAASFSPTASAMPRNSARRRSWTPDAHRRVRDRARPRRDGCRRQQRRFPRAVLAAVKHSGERYWHMPLFEDYGKQMKSDIADLKNTGAARPERSPPPPS